MEHHFPMTGNVKRLFLGIALIAAAFSALGLLLPGAAVSESVNPSNRPISEVLSAGSSLTDESAMRQALEAQFPGETIDSVSRTPYLGLYEVVVQGKIFYTDASANYLFVGSVVDTRTRRDLTAESLRKIRAAKFDALPFHLAIKSVKGNGKRKVAIFSDPDCPFCQRLERELVNVTDVTIFTFLFPIEGLHPDAKRKSRLVWCARDRAKAWDDLMLRGVVPNNGGACETPLDQTVALGQKLGVRGTPTLFFSDGNIAPGAVPAPQLEGMLSAGHAGESPTRGN